MPALYGGAAAFALPSLYEGFGLPVLEAMACGTPVLTSNTGATAEVAGDAAVLVDPRSVDAIRDGRAVADLRRPRCAHRPSRARLQRAAEFSWERAANETHAVYDAGSGRTRVTSPSVIVTYNSAGCIARCLESLRARTPGRYAR